MHRKMERSRIRRYTDPHIVHSIMLTMRSLTSPAAQETVRTAVQCDLGNYQLVADQLVDQMVADGFLLFNAKKQLVIPDFSDQNVRLSGSSHHDWYCYECHNAGEVISCVRCPRVFHINCIRLDMDRPMLPLKEPVAKYVRELYEHIHGQAYSRVAVVPSWQSNENKRDSHQYCVRCRLILRDKLKISAGTDIAELNYLLTTVFQQIKSWIGSNTFSSRLERPITASDIDLFSRLLMHEPTTMKVIAQKLQRNAYSSLVAFQCDLMDVQHCLGVFYGEHSATYDDARYMVMDATHHLMEIVHCKDCYRHSTEKSNNWFCKPCPSFAHDVVYVKQKGFSTYWPAKVTRIVEPDMYHVRYFGGRHMRAIVDAKCLLPISTDLSTLTRKEKMTGIFKKAMDELKMFMELSQEVPLDRFAYQQVTDVAAVAGNAEVTHANGSLVIHRKSRPKAAKVPRKRRATTEIPIVIDSLLFSKNKQPNPAKIGQKRRATYAIIPENFFKRPKTGSTHALSTISMFSSSSSSSSSPPPPQLLTHSNDVFSAHNEHFTLEDVFQQINNCNSLAECRATAIRALSVQMTVIEKNKEKHWCILCKKSGQFYCCWRATYCSELCQKTHWKSVHKSECQHSH